MFIKDIVLINKKDIVYVLCILSIALIFIFLNILSNKSIDIIYAEVLLNGVNIKTIPLDNDTVLNIEQRPEVVLQILNGGIGFIESDCPDQVCIHSGFLTRPGQVAACLPNGLTLMVLGKSIEHDNIDIFTN